MMTPKEKKEYGLLGILLLATFAVIYFIFFRHDSLPAVKVDTTATTPGGTAVPVIGAFLPNGADLNLNILDDPRFKQLAPPAYPQVRADEIGNDNLFSK